MLVSLNADSTSSTGRVNLTGRFQFLDGLRGVAAVSVMFFHFFNHWVSPIHDSLAAILPRFIQVILDHADLGVEIFFVISGFVIAHSLFDKAITPAFAGKFILRRSLRLDPPYWLIIGVSIALPYLLFPQSSAYLLTRFGGAGGIVINMFYLPDLLWKPRIIGVAWTLCLEVQFYLALLLILFLLENFKRVMLKAGVTIIAAAAAVLLAYSIHRWFTQGENDFGGRWYMFFTGVLTYWTLAGRIHRRIFLAYLAALLVLTAALGDLTCAVILGTTLLIYISAHLGGLQGWLGNRPIQYLGRISYSLYLVHMTLGIAALNLLVQHISLTATGTFLCLVVAIAVSFISADLLNRFVEAPAMRLGKALKVFPTIRWPRRFIPHWAWETPFRSSANA